MQQNIFANVAGSRRSNNYICNMQHMLCCAVLCCATWPQLQLQLQRQFWASRAKTPRLETGTTHWQRARQRALLCWDNRSDRGRGRGRGCCGRKIADCGSDMAHYLHACLLFSIKMATGRLFIAKHACTAPAVTHVYPLPLLSLPSSSQPQIVSK